MRHTTIFKSLLLAGLLSLAGAGQAWAVDWVVSGGLKSGTWTYGPSNCMYYNGCSSSTNWGNSSNGRNASVGGDYYLNNAGTSTYNGVQIEMVIYSYTRTISPYTKLVRTVSFASRLASNRHHHGGGIYLFDSYNTAANTWVDATYEQSRSSDGGESYKILKSNSYNTNGDHCQGSSGSKTMTFDNSTGSAETNISKYLLFEHSSANAGSARTGNEWMCFYESSSSEVWWYYKTVSFDANGGSGTISSITVENCAILPQNTFTPPSGKIFAGWNTKADGTGTAYDDRDAITATSGSKGPVTLYAQWADAQTEAASVSFAWNQQKGYQASSDYNTNSFTNLPYTSANSDWTQSGNTVTATPTLSPYYQVCIQRYNRGYWAGDLVDWFTMTYTVPPYSTVTFTTDWCVQAAQTDPNSRSSVRAAYFDYETDKNSYWSSRAKTPTNYSVYKTSSGISFGANGGQVWDAGTYTYYGENAAAWIYRATNNKGYVTKSVTVDNSDGADYKSESRYGAFSSSKSVTSSNGTFPHWTHLKAKNGGMVYTYYKIVNFDANGGTGSTMAQQKVGTVQQSQLDSTALSANTYVLTGQKFAGWNTEADGSGTSYADCGNIVAKADDKGPVTLYAQWEEKVATETDTTGKTKISLDEHVSTEDVVYSLENLPKETKTITTVDMSEADDITGDLSDIIDNIRNNPKSTPNTLIYLPVLKEGQSVPSDKAENVVVKDTTGQKTTYKCVNFSVTDKTPVSVPYAFSADVATYRRDSSSRWGTVCVPFKLKSDGGIQYYTSGTVYGTGDNAQIVWEKADTVAAGCPAVYMVSDIDTSGTDGSTSTKKDIIKTDYVKVVGTAASESGSSVKLVGTFTEKKIASDTTGFNIYYFKDNKFYKREQNQNVTIPALRAYILIPTEQQ